MKKLTAILAALVLFTGVSFAQSTHSPKADTKKAQTKKSGKKVPPKKEDKKAAAAIPAAK